ncbi:DUF1684 domain-containing protein [Nonomuraea typhae]|uniref:DUF1684 domain-containing protein n=1 Tax=Nonomuraea typhae TaxID=2603600 RepID=A0ABW7Z6W1_9ACTN
MAASQTAHQAWRKDRWEEVAGANGKAKVVANAKIIGRDAHTLPGLPGTWSTDEAGALTVTAAAADGVQVDGRTVDGGAVVPAGSRLDFPGGRVGFAGGGDGAYGLVVMDPAAVERSGLRGIDTYPYDPSWVFEGRYRAAPSDRRIEVERLTSPRSTEAIAAPVDLVVTINGTEHVLAVLEDFPGQRLVVFTDETNGVHTPAIGRWLVLPPSPPGSTLSVDFNQAILSHHHLNPDVFVCPLSPPGNHLAMRVEAGERALVHDQLADRAVGYLRSLERADWDGARAMCARTATVWHNDGKGEQSIEENIRHMADQAGAIASMRYAVLRQFSRPGEVLQQHVVHVAMRDGLHGQVHAAAYFRFDDHGLITRIEEYATFVPGAAA